MALVLIKRVFSYITLACLLVPFLVACEKMKNLDEMHTKTNQIEDHSRSIRYTSDDMADNVEATVEVSEKLSQKMETMMTETQMMREHLVQMLEETRGMGGNLETMLGETRGLGTKMTQMLSETQALTTRMDSMIAQTTEMSSNLSTMMTTMEKMSEDTAELADKMSSMQTDIQSMSNKLDSMKASMDILVSKMDLLSAQMNILTDLAVSAVPIVRQGAAASIRNDSISKMEEAVSLQRKVKYAVHYYYAFEFQVFRESQGYGYDSLERRETMFKEAMEDFFRDISEYIVDREDFPRPEGRGNEFETTQRRSAIDRTINLYAMALAMHKINSIQQMFQEEQQDSYQQESIYSLIMEALQRNHQAREAGRSIQEEPQWVKEVLVHYQKATYIMQLRFIALLGQLVNTISDIPEQAPINNLIGIYYNENPWGLSHTVVTNEAQVEYAIKITKVILKVYQDLMNLQINPVTNSDDGVISISDIIRLMKVSNSEVERVKTEVLPQNPALVDTLYENLRTIKSAFTGESYVETPEEVAAPAPQSGSEAE